MGLKSDIYKAFEKGDILFFPSHILHGLSSHNSDVIRKTLSFNFDILD